MGQVKDPHLGLRSLLRVLLLASLLREGSDAWERSGEERKERASSVYFGYADWSESSIDAPDGCFATLATMAKGP